MTAETLAGLRALADATHPDAALLSLADELMAMHDEYDRARRHRPADWMRENAARFCDATDRLQAMKPRTAAGRIAKAEAALRGLGDHGGGVFALGYSALRDFLAAARTEAGGYAPGAVLTPPWPPRSAMTRSRQ